MASGAQGGGTGSGLGSFLLETLSDRYDSALLLPFSLLPALTGDASDVVVEPYNAMLALKRLALHADAVVAMSNDAIHRILAEKMRVKNPALEQTNALVRKTRLRERWRDLERRWRGSSLLATGDDASVSACTLVSSPRGLRPSWFLWVFSAQIAAAMSWTTAPCRFLGCLHSELLSLLSSLIPVPRCHFLVSGLAPVATCCGAGEVLRQKHSVQDVMRRLLQHNNVMASHPLDAFPELTPTSASVWQAGASLASAFRCLRP